MTLPIQDLEPDFYIAPTTQATANLKKLVDLLYDKGFAPRSDKAVWTNCWCLSNCPRTSSRRSEKDLIKNYEVGYRAYHDAFNESTFVEDLKTNVLSQPPLQQHLVNAWGVQNCHLIEDRNTELAQVNEKYEEKSSYFHSNNATVSDSLKQLAFIPIALLACFCIEIFLTDIYNGPGKSLLTLFYSKYLLQLKEPARIPNQPRKIEQTNSSIFIVTNQVIQLVLKYLLPLGLRAVFDVIDKVQKKPTLDTKSDNPSEAVWLHNVRLSLKLPEYNVDDELQSIFKPPVPKRVDSIHPWNLALFLLAWIGSVVSPVVTTFYRHGTAPPKTLGQFAFDKASTHVSSTVALVLLMFATEHGFLILSYALYKLSTLFKSEVEWENDFVDNDIKLRHDYYSGRVKPTFKVHPDERWDKFTPQSTLSFRYSNLPLLKQKEAELSELEKSRQNLEAFKDPTDTVITSKSKAGGAPVFSTIDNNTHIDDLDKKDDKITAAPDAKDPNCDVIDAASVNSKTSSSKVPASGSTSSGTTGSSPHRGPSLKEGAHKTKKKMTDVVHNVEDSADYKKFLSEAEKEAKKSKSGIKKLFKK
ncbi:hypothetical protein Cantr_03560 [Candida viswanathii]|uniref:Anoctamin transmembrane domain-containing protein n=1 Tax=Candida viswanathii TaxID=5486 RepID=A0A367YLC0_9ASCO|nr:hypothetical protein Cantr_03560 [Candida viswanathii]